MFATCLVLGLWENMGKQRKYIFSYFGMFSDYIHDFDFFFWFAWCLGAEKMWESKEK